MHPKLHPKPLRFLTVRICSGDRVDLKVFISSDWNHVNKPNDSMYVGSIAHIS